MLLLYELLDPETKVQRVRSYGLSILHSLLSVDVVLGVSWELLRLDIALQYYSGGATRLRFMNSVAGQ